MHKVNRIQYLHDKNIELILSVDSEISYPRHNHVSVFTISLVLRGAIFLTVGDNSFTCQTDSSFTILPYTPHTIEAQAPYSLVTLCIDKNLIGNFRKDEIKNNVGHLLAATGEWNLIESQILPLLNSLDSLGAGSFFCSADPFIYSAKEQIERCPERKLNLDEMARSSHMSKYHFIRRFRQAVGLTPHQFQIQNRVRKAQRLLSGVDNITEVALTTGFCDQSHFIKHFERYVGLTPTVYKNSCKTLI